MNIYRVTINFFGKSIKMYVKSYYIMTEEGIKESAFLKLMEDGKLVFSNIETIEEHPQSNKKNYKPLDEDETVDFMKGLFGLK
jgi:hypothetical protein